jgi:ketosteroid isomerase-like protein
LKKPKFFGEIMKICPTCQNRYTDDTLLYCLQDGAALVIDESQNPAPTVAFPGETETVVKNRQSDPPPKPQESQTWDWKTHEGANYQTRRKTSNTTLILVTALLAMILVFGVIGIGAWLYFSKDRQEVAQNTKINSSTPENKRTNTNVNSAAFPSPNVSKTPAEEKTPTPTPDFDPEQIEEEVSETVNSWVSLTVSRNLSAYMNTYADTVDYYNRKGASASAVRADKQRAFAAFDTIEMEISNMRVTPDASGETATAVFDKEWHFEGDGRSSEGKVQSQLRLRKIGGAWKITGEKDLKVYYTN